MEKYIAPSICPVCGGEYEITTLTCKKCKSELSGRFEGCAFCSLPKADMNFITTFIRCRGNIKDVERELGISYPTVRSRLDAVISRLGYAVTEDAAIKQERAGIIARLEAGEITADEATAMLKSLGK